MLKKKLSVNTVIGYDRVKAEAQFYGKYYYSFLRKSGPDYEIVIRT